MTLALSKTTRFSYFFLCVSRQVLSEIENVREQSASLKDGLRDMTAKEQQLKRVHHSKQEKMSKITLQHHSKMQGTKESIQHYQGSVLHASTIGSRDIFTCKRFLV